jgi:hypothetical protein
VYAPHPARITGRSAPAIAATARSRAAAGGAIAVSGRQDAPEQYGSVERELLDVVRDRDLRHAALDQGVLDGRGHDLDRLCRVVDGRVVDRDRPEEGVLVDLLEPSRPGVLVLDLARERDHGRVVLLRVVEAGREVRRPRPADGQAGRRHARQLVIGRRGHRAVSLVPDHDVLEGGVAAHGVHEPERGGARDAEDVPDAERGELGHDQVRDRPFPGPARLVHHHERVLCSAADRAAPVVGQGGERRPRRRPVDGSPAASS